MYGLIDTGTGTRDSSLHTSHNPTPHLTATPLGLNRRSSLLFRLPTPMFLLATMLKDGLTTRNCSSYAPYSSHHPSLLTSGPFRTYSQAYPDSRLVRASIPPPPSQCQATVGPQRPSSGAQLPPGGCPVRHVGVDGARATIAEQGRWAPLLCRRQGPKSPTLFARKLYVAETPFLHVFDFFCYSSRLYYNSIPVL